LASQINASNSGFGGVVTTGDSSGILALQTAGTTALTLDTSQNATFAGKVTSAGALTLASNGTTTAVTIDTSQNVGIGITNPSYKTVISNSGAEGFEIGTGYSSGKNLFQSYNRSGSSYVQADNVASVHTWQISGSEKMRIDSSGNVLIGATSSYAGTEKLSVTSTIAGWPASLNCTGSSTNGLLVRYSTSPNNGGAEFFSGNDSTTARCYFKSNGGLANYSANNTNLSDVREKKAIQLAGSYLDKICAIPVKTFLFNDQTDTELNLGVIAQDVQAVAPELVMESNWAAPDQPEKLRLSIYQTDLQYALMKAIQEQQTIINDLKARIETLEAK
jgi:hypothetical protein